MKEKESKPKRGRGRPVTKPMPELIPDNPGEYRQSGADKPEGSTRRVAVLKEAEGLVWARWSE